MWNSRILTPPDIQVWDIQVWDSHSLAAISIANRRFVHSAGGALAEKGAGCDGSLHRETSGKRSCSKDRVDLFFSRRIFDFRFTHCTSNPVGKYLLQSEKDGYLVLCRGSSNRKVTPQPANRSTSTAINTVLKPKTSIINPINVDEMITGRAMQTPSVLR